MSTPFHGSTSDSRQLSELNKPDGSKTALVTDCAVRIPNHTYEFQIRSAHYSGKLNRYKKTQPSILHKCLVHLENVIAHIKSGIKETNKA